ncbi:MAG TPA: hypothetical protein VND92_11765 [Vicinamibacterales bacterium]|nr:hypothetical protein [Vicinamibacterales bacterium]
MTDPSATPDLPSENRGLMIVLAYLWLLALVPLILEKNDREVQWHAKHGLVLMVAEILLGIAPTVVMSVAAFATFGLGCFVSLLTASLWLAILVVHVAAIIRGLRGERLIIPGVSEYADRL